MRAQEFAIETQELDEIQRISADDYTGGKQYLYNKSAGKQIRKLPGGSGLLYSASENRHGGTDIKLWDPNGQDYLAQKAREAVPKPAMRRGESRWSFQDRMERWAQYQQGLQAPGQLIGKLSVSRASWFPLSGAVQVETITVDEDYRGMSLAKALYGIVLTILKKPLLAGGMQTPGGRRNWVSLSQIPGVEMKGYVTLDDDELDASGRKWWSVAPKVAEKNIDVVMGQLGGQHIGTKGTRHYFAFDVQPNTTGKELEAYVATKLNKVYGGSRSDSAGLYAVWTGQA